VVHGADETDSGEPLRVGRRIPTSWGEPYRRGEFGELARRRALGAVPQWELLLLAGVFARDWAISIPDHEGTDGHWGAPREPGYCTLDGIRAALSFDPLGLEASTPVGLWGYSGGGLATSWAAEMAPDYAPDINLVGAALGSPSATPPRPSPV